MPLFTAAAAALAVLAITAQITSLTLAAAPAAAAGQEVAERALIGLAPRLSAAAAVALLAPCSSDWSHSFSHTIQNDD